MPSNLPPSAPRPRSCPIWFISQGAARIARHDHERLTPEDLLLFIKAAQPGDRLIYHAGFLADDLDKVSVRIKSRVVNSLRGFGMVALLQRRLREYHYQYIMVKTTPPDSFSTGLSRTEEIVRLSQSRSQTG